MRTAARQKQLDNVKRRQRDRALSHLGKMVARREPLGRTTAGEPFDKLDAMLDGVDDGWEFIRRKIIELAGDRGEWAGYPLPVEHAALTIEPRHPLYKTLNGSQLKTREESEPNDVEIVNAWTDYDRGRQIVLYRERGGRVQHFTRPVFQSTQRASMVLDTLGASQAWSVRAEFTAMARLKTLVTPTAFRYYLLTGTFIESSRRSGTFYLFRRCRPTIAFKGILGGDNTKLLAALCLHPIGYYEQTFAGSMVPTDDVIAHLVMMRGDERKYWSKCNQHDCRDAAAGV